MVEGKEMNGLMVLFIIGFVFCVVGLAICYYTLYESGIWTLKISSCCDFWLDKQFLDDVSVLSHIGFILGLCGIIIISLSYFVLLKEAEK